MSDETKLLPPHEAAATDDATSFIRSQRAVPKRPYGDPAGTAQPKPDPPSASQKEEVPPAGEAPKGDTESPSTEDSAREFIETYDLLQSFGFHMYSNGLPMEKFALPEKVKERATHHLARGLVGMGKPQLPWPVGLAIALAPPSFFNYLLAKEHRTDMEQREADARSTNKERQRNGEPLSPTVIYDAHGNVVSRPDATKPRPQAPGAPDRSNACPKCGKPAKPGRTYCSQSCSGAASRGRRRKNTPNTTDDAVS